MSVLFIQESGVCAHLQARVHISLDLRHLHLNVWQTVVHEHDTTSKQLWELLEETSALVQVVHPSVSSYALWVLVSLDVCSLPVAITKLVGGLFVHGVVEHRYWAEVLAWSVIL